MWKYALQRNRKFKKFANKLCKSEILESLEFINHSLSHYDDRDINLLPIDDETTNIIHRMKKRLFQQKYEYMADNYGHILPKDCWSIIINEYDDIDLCLLPSQTQFYSYSCSRSWFYRIYGNISNLIQLILIFVLIINPWPTRSRWRFMICSLLFMISFIHIMFGYLIYEIHFDHKYISMLHRFKAAMGNKVDYRDIELFEPFQEFCGVPLFWNVCIYKKTYSLYRKYKIICNKSCDALLSKYLNICIYSMYLIISTIYPPEYEPESELETNLNYFNNLRRTMYECLLVTYIGCLLSMYIVCHNSIYQNEFVVKNASFGFFITGLYIGCFWCIYCIFCLDCFKMFVLSQNVFKYLEFLKHLPMIIWGIIWGFKYRFKMILMLFIVWYSYLVIIVLSNNNNKINEQKYHGFLYQIIFIRTEWTFILFRLCIAILMFGDLYWTFIWNHSKHIVLFYFLPIYRRFV